MLQGAVQMRMQSLRERLNVLSPEQRCYALQNLAYHLRHAQLWAELEEVLTDLVFIAAMGEARLLQNTLGEYTTTLSAESFPVPLRRRVEEFAQFVRSRNHILTLHPELTVPEAFNFAVSGYVLQRAQALLQNRKDEPWLRRLNRPHNVSGKCVHTMRGHAMPVISVAVAPGGGCVISGSNDTTGRIWNVETGACEKILVGHTSGVTAIAITPDGLRIITGSADHTCRVWDSGTAQCLYILEGHTATITALLHVPVQGTVVSGSADGAIKVWDIETGRSVNTFEGNCQPVCALAVLCQGKGVIIGRCDSTIQVWDISTNILSCNQLIDSGSAVVMAIHPDGNMVATGDEHGVVKLWDRITCAHIHTLEGHSGWIGQLAFTSDGDHLVSEANRYDLHCEIKFWSYKDGTCYHTIGGPIPDVRALALMPERSQILTGSDDSTVQIWNMRADTEQSGHNGPSTSIAVTQDSQYAVTVAGGSAQLWDIVTGTSKNIIECSEIWAHTAVALSDRKHVMIAGGRAKRKGGIVVYNLMSAEKVCTITVQDTWPTSATATSDGQVVVFGSDDGYVRMHCLSTGKCFRTTERHERFVSMTALTPNDQQLVSVGGSVKGWDVATGECLYTLPLGQRSVYPLLLTPDGQQIVTASGRSVEMWNMVTGECIRKLEDHPQGVVALAVTQDSQKLVTSQAGTIMIWDLATGACERRIEETEDIIVTIAVTSNGQFIVSGNQNNSVNVWDMKTGRHVASFFADASIWKLASAPDGIHIIAGDRNGQQYLLSMEQIDTCSL